MLNLAVLLEDSARTFPDRDAVVHGKTRLTYAELEAEASRVAGALASSTPAAPPASPRAPS